MKNFKVIIESPYKGFDMQDNINYARRCMLHSLQKGEAPFLSHLLYTQVLDDDIPEERKMGLTLAQVWYDAADLCAVYTDRGISIGMEEGINHALSLGLTVEERSIGHDKSKKGSARSYTPRWR